ncbi:MAG: hypothetical protein WAM14_27335 [Candidatus Nitrosopolaris sp.]
MIDLEMSASAPFVGYVESTERAGREVSLGIEQKFGNELRKLIANQNWQILMSFRIGYSDVLS